MKSYATLETVLDARGVLEVTLDRPDVRNAFDARLIAELREVFEGPAREDAVRMVVLRGRGRAFCAGADLNWMRASAELTAAENRAEAEKMAAMFGAIAATPVPVLAVAQGAALGGGAGLVAACDFALVEDEAKIGFTEVLLGIVPAVISPFVLRKVGDVHVRRYFCTGEIFDGREAARIGLAQAAHPMNRLDEAVEALVRSLLRAGPEAVRSAKRLIGAVRGKDHEQALAITAPWIADIRGSAEGRAGIAAFLEKRPAPWIARAEENA